MKRALLDLDPSVAALLPCAICGRRGQRPRTPHHMTHGITIWLCDQHHSDEYMTRREGHEFVERLAGAWAAAGMLTIRRHDALHAHLHTGSNPRVQTASDQAPTPGPCSDAKQNDATPRENHPLRSSTNSDKTTATGPPWSPQCGRCAAGSPKPDG